MNRQTDHDIHEKECFHLHHEHDKRIAKLETKITSLENNHAITVEEIKLNVEKNYERSERIFSEFTNAINGLRVDLATFIASTSAKTSIVKDLYPIVFTMIAAVWAIYSHFSK